MQARVAYLHQHTSAYVRIRQHTSAYVIYLGRDAGARSLSPLAARCCRRDETGAAMPGLVRLYIRPRCQYMYLCTSTASKARCCRRAEAGAAMPGLVRLYIFTRLAGVSICTFVLVKQAD
jgi:hypothetical protein